MDMRGLKNFIKDIREANDNRDAEVRRVEEEMSKIRSKFKSSSALSPYDRKKYVCKLLFIFMLGYPVEFGHMQCITLLSGESASEKLIGYLSMALLLHEGHPILTLTTHTVTKDLSVGDDMRKCLALTAVANIGGRDFADAMTNHVMDLVTSKVTPTIVRKKAMLAALRLQRKFKCIDVNIVGPAAADAVLSTDMALSMAAATLCTGLLSDAAHVDRATHANTMTALGSAQINALRMLERIILEKASPAEFVHFGVPSPWLQGKLVRLLQEFPPPSNVQDQEAISGILARIVRATKRAIEEAQANVTSRTDPLLIRSNCMVSVLAEIVAIAIQWNVSNRLLSDCREALALLLNDRKDQNRRYVGLSLLCRMSYLTAADGDSEGSLSFAQQISKYNPVIVAALHDADESLRKRALELLYAMCDASNAAQIVGELLEYLPIAEAKFREDLVLMIAILAEKFCGEVTWYVDVMVAVIEIAGEVVPEDAWQRLVHVCVNAQAVQSHAVEVVFRALQRSRLENHVLTRVAAVVLGEFGYQIALVSGSSPAEQLALLQAKFGTAPDALKAMLLNTFVKFYNLYDNTAVREKIKKILLSARSSLDAELQQRAAEYYCLVCNSSDEVLQAALEPLPPFEMQATTMADKLRAKQKGESRDLWLEKGGERDLKQLRQSAVLRSAAATGVAETREDDAKATAMQETARAAQRVTGPGHVDPHEAALAAVRDGAALAAKLRAASGGSRPGNNQEGAAAAGAPAGSATAAAPPAAAAPAEDPLESLFKSVASPPPVVSSSASSDEARLALQVRISGAGAIYESNLVLITARVDHRASDARATITITNKHTKPLEGLSVRIASTPASLMVQQQPLASQGPISTNQSVDALFASRCLQAFDEPAHVAISGSFAGEGVLSLSLCLPFYVTTFFDPYRIDDAAKFLPYWQNTKSGNNGTCRAEKARLSARRLDAASGDATAAIEKALFEMKFFTIRSDSSSIGGVAAHNGMPAEQVTFTPVMVTVKSHSGGDPFDFSAQQSPDDKGRFTLEVRCPDAVLERQTFNYVLAVLKDDPSALTKN